MEKAQKYAFWAITFIVIGGVLALTIVSADKNNATTISNDGSSSRLLLSKASDERAVLVEYSDFQCPACANMYQLLSTAKQDYGDQITFEFRHFPLTTIHPNAMTAHRIAQAASNQNQFNAVHDALFESSSAWSQSSNPSQSIYTLIEDTVSDIDIEQLKSDVSDSATLAAINSDVAAGNKQGVQGTPTLFLNGEKLEIGSYTDLQAALDEKISNN